jgi:hypothetical protein
MSQACYKKTLQQLSKKIALVLGCLGASLLCSLPAQAQHQGWYQVEMIVFARKYPENQEHWPSNIRLRYPSNWVELKDPNQLSEEAIDTAVDAGANSMIDLAKAGFYQLPSSEQSLGPQAQKLARDSRYQLLFHQAWRQEIGSQKNAKSILIYGGETFGEHQQLEGSIRLSVATYLKIQTNLWLSAFDINVGQEQTNNWPAIPLRPNRAAVSNASLALDADFTHALTAENNQWKQLDDSNFDAATSSEEKDAYITREIILVREERDMRSTEVHYLDHPVVGIIIKIIPYSSGQ